MSTAFRRKVAAEISPCRRAVLIVNQSKRPLRLGCRLTNLHFLKYNSRLTEVKWISNSKNPITLFDDRISLSKKSSKSWAFSTDWNVPPGRFLTLRPSRVRIPCYKKSEIAQRQPPIFGGELGIRRRLCRLIMARPPRIPWCRASDFAFRWKTVLYLRPKSLYLPCFLSWFWFGLLMRQGKTKAL